MITYNRKRGYVKWTDENGVKHKVPEAEFEKMNEENMQETISGTETEYELDLSEFEDS